MTGPVRARRRTSAATLGMSSAGSQCRVMPTRMTAPHPTASRIQLSTAQHARMLIHCDGADAALCRKCLRRTRSRHHANDRQPTHFAPCVARTTRRYRQRIIARASHAQRCCNNHARLIHHAFNGMQCSPVSSRMTHACSAAPSRTRMRQRDFATPHMMQARNSRKHLVS